MIDASMRVLYRDPIRCLTRDCPERWFHTEAAATMHVMETRHTRLSIPQGYCGFGKHVFHNRKSVVETFACIYCLAPREQAA